MNSARSAGVKTGNFPLMMKRLPLFFLALIFAANVQADEQLRAVQQALKDQGFYYGEVDGEEGIETSAAVRRFQIRNGLEVTGKLNPETLAAMKVGNATAPAPPPATAQDESRSEATPAPRTPPADVVESDRNFLHQPAARPPAAPAPDHGEDAGTPPARENPTADYASVFRKTPYETAPLEVQRSTLKRAQSLLATEGFYHGIVDGEPRLGTERALADFQREADLPPTGRLDMTTLAEMRLLPNRRIVVPRPVSPFVERDEPVSIPPRRVYRGIWVH